MDINQIMKQAQAMQKQLEETNKQIAAIEFEGTASNDLVKVKCNGEYKITNVDIDASIINKDDKDMIQDLIMIATNEAIDKVNNQKKEKFGNLAGGLGIR